jgi:hypothetical protein
MVEFSYRTDYATRRNIRELDGDYAQWATPLDAPPPVFRPVDGGLPVNDPTLSGENIDHMVDQFIARLKSPGAQISAPALQRLVATITEMVNALAGGMSQPSASSGARGSAPLPPALADSKWIPAQPFDAQGNIPGADQAWAAEEQYIPATDGQYTGYSPEEADEFPDFEGGGTAFPSFRGEQAAQSGTGNGMYMIPTGQSPILFQPLPETPIERGIPISFIKEFDEDGEEIELPDEPTLYDFIMGLTAPSGQGIHV